MKLGDSARTAFAKHGADDTLHRLFSDPKKHFLMESYIRKSTFCTRREILQENDRMYAELQQTHSCCGND
jgi:hypothetical protein